MIRLNKAKGKDFTILNLTDPHFDISEWDKNGVTYKIFDYTVKELVKRVNPDLITVSGDISWGADHYSAYKDFADYMEELGIFWAPVWGNHDDEDGDDIVEEIADLFLTYKTCVYEKGDKKYGNGNYVIEICEDEKTVEALLMMDTHSNVSKTVLDIDCNLVNSNSYASLTGEQIEWYKKEVEKLYRKGCSDSTLVIHIPIYGYREAFYAAMQEDKRARGAVSIEDSYKGVGWKEEYKESCFGVNRDGICSPDYDDGVLPVLVELGHTKHVIAGHDHINNFCILYKGIRLAYGMKLGKACYWASDLNGGTVLTVGENGVKKIHHEYVDVSEFLE